MDGPEIHASPRNDHELSEPGKQGYRVMAHLGSVSFLILCAMCKRWSRCKFMGLLSCLQGHTNHGRARYRSLSPTRPEIFSPILHHAGQLEVRTLVKCMLKWVQYWQTSESLRTAEAAVEERSESNRINHLCSLTKVPTCMALGKEKQVLDLCCIFPIITF
jgi:hypothetical protein